MNTAKLHNSLTNGYTLFIIALLYFLGIRLCSVEFPGNPDLWITSGIQLLTAFFLLYLVQHFIIIRGKNFLPFILYILLVSVDPSAFFCWKESLYTFCVLMCFYFLFQSYEEECPQRQALNIGIFLTVGAIFHPLFYLLILVFIWGLYQFKSLSFKTFLAGFCGSLLVFVLLFCWCLYQDNPSLFLDFFPDWKVFLPTLFNFNLVNSFLLVYLLLFFISSGVTIYMAGISEKIKNHVILSFLFFFSLFIFILIIIEAQWEMEWTGFLYLSLSILLAHFFSKKTNKLKTFLLIFSVLFFIGIGIWNTFFNF